MQNNLHFTREFRMKILFANNYYYNRGGSEQVFFGELKLLKDNGIVVDSFSYNDLDSIEKYGYNESFLDEPKTKIKRAYERIGGLFYNYKASIKIDRKISKGGFDILHMHNIHSRLSHSITDVAYKRGVKSVLTLHDYKYICPHYTLMYSDKICEDCRGGKYYNAVLNKCHKNSYIASGLVALEAYNFESNDIYNKIDTFISPSRFLMNKYKDMGFKGNIEYIPNFVDMDSAIEIVARKEDKYYVFVGRLSYEKGILNLLMSFKFNNKKLLIIGGGPMQNDAANFINNNNMMDRVFLTGHITSEKVYEFISKSKAIIVPSKWYENAPISILEALHYGKLIIGSNIGGIPEMVHDGDNGFLFDHDDYLSINKAIEKVESLTAADIARFRDYSRNLVDTMFSKSNHLRMLTNLYKRILEE
jgi:glycosyltransferase involved in cell wall biosynthesis